jgi:hypothetical protein
VNLDLPFVAPEPTVLDEYLAEIDRALDALFMEAVSGELDRLRVERLEPADDAAA